MIKSKLRAYRYDNGTWHVVTRWDLLKLSEVDFEKYRTSHFPFLYFQKSLDSPRLTFNKGQKTFRFLPKAGEKDSENQKGMTISHILAQEVLSEMETFKFSLMDKRKKPYKRREIEIKVDQTLIEKSVLDGKYIVDLLVFFSSPPELALKWNRCFAIEIMVTNAVDGNKMTDFENAKLPLIEVELGEQLVFKKSAMETTEKEENELRDYITNSFRKSIRGYIFVDTSSDKYLENEAIISLQNIIERLSLGSIESDKTIKSLHEEKTKIEANTDQLNKIIQEHRQINDKLNKEIEKERDTVSRLKNELNEFRNKSLVGKIANHFFGKEHG